MERAKLVQKAYDEAPQWEWGTNAENAASRFLGMLDAALSQSSVARTAAFSLGYSHAISMLREKAFGGQHGELWNIHAANWLEANRP